MYTQIYSLGDPETNPQNTLACSFTAKQIDIKKKSRNIFLEFAFVCLESCALVHGLSYSTKEINLLFSVHPLSPTLWKPSGISWQRSVALTLPQTLRGGLWESMLTSAGQNKVTDQNKLLGQQGTVWSTTKSGCISLPSF